MYEQLYPFQRRAVDFVLERQRVGLFFEQGTGKTWITMGTLSRLYAPGFCALVIVPLTNLQSTWERSLRAQLPRIPVARAWEDFKEGVLLMHYEGLSSLPDRVLRRVLKHRWDLIVYDESQRLKGRGTEQSRIAGRFKHGTYRVGLSGTPIEQAPQDLWAQFRFIKPDLLGKSWPKFAGIYSVWGKPTWEKLEAKLGYGEGELRRINEGERPKGKIMLPEGFLKPAGYRGYKTEFRGERLQEYLSLLKPYSMRITKEDVLDLPTLTYQHHKVRLLGEQKEVYHDIRTRMMSEDFNVTTGLKITQLVRLQQVCGGFIKDDDGKVLTLPSAKLRALRRILRHTEVPAVIFCKYREEVNQITDCLDGFSYEVLSGKNRKDRDNVIHRFQSGKTDILVCQIRAGGVGVDLQNANVAIFFSTTFSYIDFDQAVSRVHRHGQTRPVTIHLIYAKNTVDASIYSAVLSKRSVSEVVLNRLKRSTMPKKNAAKKTTKKTKKEEVAAVEEKETAPKYGVSDLADALGIKPASVRVRLRKGGIEKAGKSYGWNTKAELQEVVDALRPNAEAAR